MKFTKYFMPFAALALLASCSDDKVVDQPAGGGNNFTDGALVATFKVNLPVNEGTRAFTGVSGDFEDGNLVEYKIDTADFYIFAAGDATSEDDYECVGISSTWSPLGSPDASVDVTREATITIQFNEDASKKLGTTGNYYGLCILNKKTGFPAPTVGQKFSAWRNDKTITSTASYVGENSFVMTNAPTYASASEAGLEGVAYLTTLDATKFVVAPGKPSNPAGTFFVQRGVAKVAIQGAKATDFEDVETDVTLSKIPMKDGDGQYFNLENWQIDITNKLSYPIQHVDKVSGEMEADAAAVNPGPGVTTRFYTNKNEDNKIGFNHIWWGDDPVYGTGRLANFNTISGVATPANAVSKTYDYCLENTMPWNKMEQNQTTRVIFKGKFSINGTTYPSFVVALDNNKAFAIDPAWLNSDYVEVNDEGQKTAKLTEADDELALEDLISSEVMLEGDTYKDFSDYFVDGKLPAIEYVSRSLGIDPSKNVAWYPGAYTYYVARIKHFNPEDETNWVAKPTFTTSTPASELYNAKHTGRYGVLRNNVYYVNIQRVLGYGSPVVPTPKDPDPEDPDNPTPDDEIEPVKYNMEVGIKVLQWAKRSYGYELK